MLARLLGVVAACAVAGATPSPAATPGYGDYTDWGGWALLQRGVQAGLASSYDRAGANADFSQYEYPPGLVRDANIPCVVATLTGPGVLWRFWMPHLTARRSFPARLYFDGESAPRIDTTSDVWLNGQYGYFQVPLVDTCAGGQVCYDPIPFAQSVRIETVSKAVPPGGWSANQHYYQWGYTLYSPGTTVTSYSGALAPEEQAARAAVAALFSNTGAHPAGSDPNAIRLDMPAQSVPGGQCAVLADLAGPGVMREIRVHMEAPTDAELAGLHLRVCYDEDALPAIDVPVGDFFGAGRGRAPYRSLPLGTDSPLGFYSYWPMPFHRAAYVALCNTTAAPIQLAGGAVEYGAGPISNDSCYLHVRREASVRAAGQVYHNMLATGGRGHYVGNLLYLEQDSYYLDLLEGDDVITVDGVWTLQGTGLEDAYNGGYYYNWVGIQPDEPEGPAPHSAIRPLHGLLYMDRHWGPEYARVEQYRWRIADRVPFASSIAVDIECQYGPVGSRWTSVAFWYQQPPLRGDLDDDGDVDGEDLLAFAACLYGPDVWGAPPTCAAADIDGDGDVDIHDFALVR